SLSVVLVSRVSRRPRAQEQREEQSKAFSDCPRYGSHLYGRCFPLTFALQLGVMTRTLLLGCFFLRVALSAVPVHGDQATISRCVDGDTLAVVRNGQAEKIRLIGVDTPELHESEKLHRDAQRTGRDVRAIQALGRKASDFVKTLIHPGDHVSLEF